MSYTWRRCRQNLEIVVCATFQQVDGYGTVLVPNIHATARLLLRLPRSRCSDRVRAGATLTFRSVVTYRPKYAYNFITSNRLPYLQLETAYERSMRTASVHVFEAEAGTHEFRY
jgi:hypothetical protein